MISPQFILANQLEAALWFAIGLGCAIVGLRTRTGVARRDALLAATVFVLFGLSDLVETRTGAWWRPAWLLAWKALCVVGLVALYWRHRRRVTQERAGRST